MTNKPIEKELLAQFSVELTAKGSSDSEKKRVDTVDKLKRCNLVEVDPATLTLLLALVVHDPSENVNKKASELASNPAFTPEIQQRVSSIDLNPPIFAERAKADAQILIMREQECQRHATNRVKDFRQRWQNAGEREKINSLVPEWRDADLKSASAEMIQDMLAEMVCDSNPKVCENVAQLASIKDHVYFTDAVWAWLQQPKNLSRFVPAGMCSREDQAIRAIQKAKRPDLEQEGEALMEERKLTVIEKAAAFQKKLRSNSNPS